MVLSMSKWLGKVAIVTGASSGIGAAIAQKLVEEGLTVVGVARRVENIQALSKKICTVKGKLYAQKADLTKEEDIRRVFDWATKNLGPVHILINNAGTMVGGGLSNGKTQDWKLVLDLNILGLCIATREAIKIMKAHNVNGHVVHINSTLGHTIANIPDLNIYSASKFAVTALTETLRQELVREKSQIKISSVSPGLVASELTTLNKNLPVETTNFFKSLPILKTEDIADAVAYVLSTPPHVQVHELTVQPVGAA